MSAMILYSPSFRHGSSCDGGVGFGGSLAIGIGSDQGVVAFLPLVTTNGQDVDAGYRESYNFT